MTKKLFTLLALCSAGFVLATTSTHAQRPSVEYNEPTATPGEQTSGFVDENGKPLSIEEYNEYRKEAAKGVYEKYPIPATLVTVAIVGGIAYLIVRWRKKKASTKNHQGLPS